MKLLKDIIKYSIPIFLFFIIFYFLVSAFLFDLYDEDERHFSINISLGFVFFVWIVSFILFLVSFNSYRKEKLEIHNPKNQHTERLLSLTNSSEKYKKISIAYGLTFGAISTYYIRSINDYLIYIISFVLTIAVIEIFFRNDRKIENYASYKGEVQYMIRMKDFDDWKKISKYPVTYTLIGASLIGLIVITNI